jgi:predicted phage tail component-like protein
VSSFETGIRDGSTLKNKRYPERIITVTYQLKAETAAEFRDAYNRLGGILDVKDAELIFADEPDKFFTGTPCTIGGVAPGSNSVVGDFEILCADPFKYSVAEFEAVPDLDNGSILLDYNGTYKSFPTLEAKFFDEKEVGDDGETAGSLTGNGDCGFVAFFNESEKIIQLGDPDEADTSGNYAKSQTLVNQTFLSNTAWGTTAKKLWSVNNGVVLPSDVVQTGSVAMAAASYSSQTTPASTSGTLLTVTSTASKPNIKYTVKAKSTDRTSSSVKLTFTITAALALDSNYFGNGYILVGSVYVGGAWHDVTLKKSSDYWKGSSAHTANLTVTVTGLTSTATSISGIKFKAYRSDSYGTAGTLAEKACSNLAISAYSAATADEYYLSVNSYGTASGKWHGPSITRTIGADAAGEVGAANFTFTYKQKMCIGNGTNSTNQLGGFHVHLSAADGKVIAGVRVVKSSAGKAASIMLFVNGVKVHQVGIDLSYYNQYFGASEKSVKASTIRKSGSSIVFNIGGYRKTFAESAVANAKVTKITFMFEQYSTTAGLSHNGLYYAKFTKDNCSTYKDVPNKFGASDIVEADCKTGEIFLNGVLAPDLGALGNDWEGFYLTPGLNQIGFAYSDWVDAGCAPSFKVRYREVFL